MIDHYVQTKPMPAGRQRPVSCSVCRALFLDDEEGREAHYVVFGHRPTREDG